MWCIVHKLHQFPALIDNGSTIAPGKDGCEKSGDLNILLLCEQVRNAHGVCFYKSRSIVFFYFRIEECFQIQEK